MRDVTIWHNPRCTKSRQTLQRLEAAGLTPSVRLYLDDPPTLAELRQAVAALGLRPRELVRTKEDVWRALSVDLDDDEAVLAALAGTPRAIERPVVFVGGRAVLGRPPENVDALIR